MLLLTRIPGPLSALFEEEESMLTFGSLLTCTALLALVALMIVFRSPDAPRWTRRSGIEAMVSVGLVCALAFGPALIVAGAMRTYQVGPNFLDLGLLGAVLLVAVWIWRTLDLRQRLRSLDARPRPAAPGAASTAVISAAAKPASGLQPAPSEPAPRRPSKPTRRAA